MRSSIKESSPSPDVMADILLLDSLFQVPGSVDFWFIQEVKDFLHFVDRTEPGFSIADYPFVIDILYGKGIDDLTAFDLENIGCILEDVARHYEALEFNREKDLQKKLIAGNFPRANYTEKDLESIMKRVYNGNPRFAKRASRTANTQAWNILRYFGRPTVKAWAEGHPNGSAVASELADIDFDGSVAKALREAIGYQAKARLNTNRKRTHYDPRTESREPMSRSELAAEAEAVFVNVFNEDPNALLQSGVYSKIFDHFRRYGISNDYSDAVDMAIYIEENLLKHPRKASRKNAMSRTSRRANRKRAKEELYFAALNGSGDMVEITAKPYGSGHIWTYQGPDIEDWAQLQISLPLPEAYDMFLSTFGLTKGDYPGPEMYTANHRANRKNTMNHTSRRANHKRAYFVGEMDWENIADEGDPIYGSSGEGLDGFYYSFYVYADEVNLVFEAQNEDTMDPKEVWTYEHGGDIPSGEYLAALGDAMAVDFVRTGGVSNPIGNVFRRANRKRANLMSLDEALQQVANASFYEDLVVIPVDGGFVVEDGYSYLAEGWEYTEMGLDGPDHFETTRLMESYESFDTAQHIRYNMPESVEALENGQAVEFAYAVVMDLDIDWGDDELNEMYEGDEVAGWLLVSQIQ